MPVPDLTPYVDLRFFDKDPQDVFDSAILDLKTRLPEWQPREGNVEVVLLEALSLEVAEAIFAANRVPEAVIMALLQLYGIDPDEGAQPLVNLRFELGDALGHDIPEGTGAVLTLAGGLEPIVFTTVEAVAVPPGATSGVVQAVGDRFTNEANGTAAGTTLELIDSILYVDRVLTDSVVLDGLEPEIDEEWIERGVQRFARLSEALVLPKHFEAAALEVPSVLRAKAFDNWNGSSPSPGGDAGYVTVAVYGDHAPVSAASKQALDVLLEDAALANLAVAVVDPTVTAVNVSASVQPAPGYDAATVTSNVVAAVEGFLDTSVWPWSPLVRRSELISVISNAEGVDFLTQLTVPSVDQLLPGVAALATAGSITVDTT